MGAAGTLVWAAGLSGAACGFGLYVQSERIHNYLEARYPEVLAGTKDSMVENAGAGEVLKFIARGRQREFQDPDLTRMCRTAQALMLGAVASGLVFVMLITVFEQTGHIK